MVLVIFAAFSFIKLPVIDGGDQGGEDSSTLKAPLSRLPHFQWGVFTQFLYIISQIGINAFALNYILDNAIVTDASGTTSTAPLFAWYGNLMHAATPDATAAYVISFAMILYAIGRFSGAAIARVIKPNVMLALYGIANSIIIVLAMANIKMVSWMILPFSWLFMSIMFPFIFAMSVRNLGPKNQNRRLIPCDGGRRRRFRVRGVDGLALGSLPQRWNLLHLALDRFYRDHDLRPGLPLAAHEIRTGCLTNYESIPRRFSPLPRRPCVRQLLCPLQRGEKMVLGNLLARRRLFLLDHLPLGLCVFHDQ